MYDGSVITVVDIVDTMMAAVAKFGCVEEGSGAVLFFRMTRSIAATNQLLTVAVEVENTFQTSSRNHVVAAVTIGASAAAEANAAFAVRTLQ